MNCNEVKTYVLAFLDGTDKDLSYEEILSHESTCAACKSEHQDFFETMKLLSSLRSLPVPTRSETAWDQSALLTRLAAVKAPKRRFSFFPLRVLVPGLVFGLFAALLLWPQSQTKAPETASLAPALTSLSPDVPTWNQMGSEGLLDIYAEVLPTEGVNPTSKDAYVNDFDKIGRVTLLVNRMETIANVKDDTKFQETLASLDTLERIEL